MRMSRPNDGDLLVSRVLMHYSEGTIWSSSVAGALLDACEIAPGRTFLYLEGRTPGHAPMMFIDGQAFYFIPLSDGLDIPDAFDVMQLLSDAVG